MPQTRKRKNKEKSDGIGGNVKKDNIIHTKSTKKKKILDETPNPPGTKLTTLNKKIHSKEKIVESSLDLETELTNKNARKKKSIRQKNMSPRKDPKLEKGKVLLSPLNVKEELNDSENVHNSLNSSDSGILSETKFSESLKSELCSSSNENICTKFEKESGSSESEWEEVEDNSEVNLDDYKPNIPEEGVEITIDCPDLHIRKRKKKEFDENEWIRLYINRSRKDVQLSVHKTHLLCLLAHGIYVNKILNSDTFKGLALSIIPDDILSYTAGKKVDKIDISVIEKLTSWFRITFSFETETCSFTNIFLSLMKSFELQKSSSASEYNLMFIIIARTLGLKTRFCISLNPVTYKASNLIQKPNGKKACKKFKSDEESAKSSQISDSNKKQKSVKLKSKKSELVDERKSSNTESKKNKDKKISRPRRSIKKNYKFSSNEEDDDSDDDFIMHDSHSSDEGTSKTHKTKSNQKKSEKLSSAKSNKRQPNRKILSSDSEPSSPQTSAFKPETIICWAEIFSKLDKQWISIECVNNIVNKPYDIENLVPQPVSYILAFDNDSFVKDVTRRYCNDYLTSTLKLRVDPEWWEETLESFLPPNSKQNKEEEKKLDEMLINKPLPRTIQEFKNHPLYALKRHLLKFEGIYPSDAPTVGFMRGEPVYSRDCVVQLHSRETWLKEARVVKIGEEPYKIVKARPKWDKMAGVFRTDLPLELFGLWQTEQYQPPVAVNGKVPRNEYGNVELFKPCMLPKGTVHLQLPGLNRIAKKLGIDCSPAVVGFDGHKGSVHPVFEGFIICKEFKETIIAAWEEEQENARKREEERREKRIYGNWKKLIKGLLIRERIKLKYETK